MVTRVSRKDYIGIINSFTEEEIKEKYGRLIVMSKSEYEEYKIKLKRTR